ncbi:nitrilase-related carbon-nitrogen hydrolase [Mycolicibacterium parafortuitum]|uniref:Nitrilase/cyanide hydratase and apolipoprotein N-acyltransferase [Pantoea sp. At-9b] n=1 Tax=Mycolicibacterium parafortuitum TaxID=39692 RepID=A0A375YD36_MYCPF|nr:nitrilase-related carbon-nitrogen hydrolase [Mycolicibacterium parafortuitum]ORB31018.1 hypothetical protein BST38_06795 [Mycolicibacterium parafortuitum]SRX79033.1 Nitrilase/cyanide hydratase and apolipoprotein N-acyltransferase [Pantoea sp. At-9b] [Mycolicibacterium parafortuitum]
MRLAAVQDHPVFLDRDASVAKAVELIGRAAADGADVIGFPEGFVPGHPGWGELHAFDDRFLELNARLFGNAIEVPSTGVDALRAACRDGGIAAVIGVCERIPGTTGTLFNTQLHITEHGELAARHQKHVPTIGERLVHAPGQTGSVNSAAAQGITISGLICGENSNPLAQYAAARAYPTVHVASWPQHFSPSLAMGPVVDLVPRSLGYSLKCYVISAVTTVSQEMIDAYGYGGAGDYLRGADIGARAAILGPAGQVLARAESDAPQLVYADVDPDGVIGPKFVHDVAGHYNRPELFAHLFAQHPIESEAP